MAAPTHPGYGPTQPPYGSAPYGFPPPPPTAPGGYYYPPGAPPGTDVKPPGRNRWKWLTGGVGTAVIAPLAVFALTREGGPLNPADPPALGGDISAVDISTGNPCCSFSVNFRFEGFRDQPGTIEVLITDAFTGMQGTQEVVAEVRPESDSDQASVTTDIPIQQAGTYTVTFILVDPDGTELDRMTTAPFDVF